MYFFGVKIEIWYYRLWMIVDRLLCSNWPTAIYSIKLLANKNRTQNRCNISKCCSLTCGHLWTASAKSLRKSIKNPTVRCHIGLQLGCPQLLEPLDCLIPRWVQNRRQGLQSAKCSKCPTLGSKPFWGVPLEHTHESRNCKWWCLDAVQHLLLSVATSPRQQPERNASFLWVKSSRMQDLYRSLFAHLPNLRECVDDAGQCHDICSDLLFLHLGKYIDGRLWLWCSAAGINGLSSRSSLVALQCTPSTG